MRIDFTGCILFGFDDYFRVILMFLFISFPSRFLETKHNALSLPVSFPPMTMRQFALFKLL